MADLQRALEFLRSGTFEPGSLEYRHWDYYDRAVMVSTTSKYSFFTVPNGQGGKLTSDSNFPLAGQLPNNERVAVLYLGFSVFPAAAPITQAVWKNWQDVLQNSYMNFDIHNKSSYLQLPLHGAFAQSNAAVITAAAAGDTLLQRDAIQHIYPLDIEILIDGGTTFKVEWIHDAAPSANLNDWELYLHLIGPRWSM